MDKVMVKVMGKALIHLGPWVEPELAAIPWLPAWVQVPDLQGEVFSSLTESRCQGGT